MSLSTCRDVESALPPITGGGFPPSPTSRAAHDCAAVGQLRWDSPARGRTHRHEAGLDIQRRTRERVNVGLTRPRPSSSGVNTSVRAAERGCATRGKRWAVEPTAID